MNEMPMPQAPDPTALVSRAAVARRSAQMAPDCRGLNFFDLDHNLRALLPLYMDAPLLAHLQPHLNELGELAGGELADLSDAAERHPPVLHARDRWGRDEEWLEFHPAYRGMEQIAFGRFGMHAMTHRAGVLGWSEKMPPLAKYVFHYLFSQAEFGLLCPVNLTDSSSELIDRYGSEEIRARYLDAIWTQDMSRLHALRPIHDRKSRRFGCRRGGADRRARWRPVAAVGGEVVLLQR